MSSARWFGLCLRSSQTGRVPDALINEVVPLGVSLAGWGIRSYTNFKVLIGYKPL